MNQAHILNNIKKYFDIREFVDKITYNEYKERAWRFFDARLLHTIYTLRFHLDKPFTANNWSWGGRFDERGLRTNICPLVAGKKGLYLSAHLRGAALDFDVEGMTASEVRKWILDHQNILPYPIRLEHKYASSGREISWVHLDVDYEPHNPKVYLFNV